MTIKTTIFGLFAAIFILGCGGAKFTKSPVDDFIRDMSKDSTFSIILYDMDEEGMFFKKYLHKYKIIREVNGNPSEKITDWYEVDEKFFAKNEDNMGMEIASKSKDGKINKIASPPGYGSYVGNSKYGQWTNSGGNSFWVFYGQYAMMQSLFNMGNNPIYRNSYDNYNNGYRGRSAYYGEKTADGYAYGTKSAFARKTNPSSNWASKIAQRSKSASRYSSGFKSRSRGGGFGK